MTFHFDRFHLDTRNLRLEDDSGLVRLTPKSFDLLRLLVERRGQLVLKDQILDSVWPDTHVADGVIKVCMAEIRAALGDSANTPRFVETVHRRGYRFIARIDAPTVDVDGASHTRPIAWPPADAAHRRSARILVGRSRETALLGEQLARALAGERQVVFVTGEPGAGKTALVEDFVSTATKEHALATTGGQSIELFGATEAYLPVLEAVGRLVRETGTARSLLRRYAPTWFAQFPWLVEEEGATLSNELLGSTRDRMLREIGSFFEAFAAETPLVLVLEDLHWSDPSTVDLLSLVASRREPARLLVIATYRPVELILGGHPLRAVSRTLAANGRAAELALDHLDLAAVTEYLDRRFPGNRFSAPAVRLLYDHTAGNPLFTVAVVEHLLARGVIAELDGRWEMTKGLRDALAEVPDSLRSLIEQQLERLATDDRRLLEAASLVGVEFSAAAAAEVCGQARADADERLERLAMPGSMLRRTGTAQWPDGTTADRYAFRHALYREALARAIPARRKADSQLRIGELLERAYGDRATELAAALAVHFAEGGDHPRAIRYRRAAAETAIGRHALVEAERHLEVALSLLASLPGSRERAREELVLQSMLGAARTATHGYAAPEVIEAYSRTLELSSGETGDPAVFPALWGLWSFSLVRGELDRALEIAQRNLGMATAAKDGLMRLVAHTCLWTTHFFRGELAQALRNLDEGEPIYESLEDHRSALAYGQDPKMVALSQRAILLWHTGRIDLALDSSRRAVEHARSLAHPMTLAFAMSFAGWLYILRREPREALAQADIVIAYSDEQGLPHWIPGAMHTRGWALTEMGEVERGIAEMERGLARMTAIGEKVGRGPRSLDLAVAHVKVGRLTEARAFVERAKALSAETGERYHQSEIHRVDAEISLLESGGAEQAPAPVRRRAERLLESAVEDATARGASTLALRSLTVLTALRRGTTRQKATRARLSALAASFTEGHDTMDLLEARRLLESMPH